MKRIIVICTLLLATFAVPVFAQTMLQPVHVTTWNAPLGSGAGGFVTAFPGGTFAGAPVVNVAAFYDNMCKVRQECPRYVQAIPYFPNRAAAQAAGVSTAQQIAVPVGQ